MDFGTLSTAARENCMTFSFSILSNGMTFKLAFLVSSDGIFSTDPRKNEGPPSFSTSTKRWGTALIRCV